MLMAPRSTGTTICATKCASQPDALVDMDCTHQCSRIQGEIMKRTDSVMRIQSDDDAMSMNNGALNRNEEEEEEDVEEEGDQKPAAIDDTTVSKFDDGTIIWLSLANRIITVKGECQSTHLVINPNHFFAELKADWPRSPSCRREEVHRSLNP